MPRMKPVVAAKVAWARKLPLRLVELLIAAAPDFLRQPDGFRFCSVSRFHSNLRVNRSVLGISHGNAHTITKRGMGVYGVVHEVAAVGLDCDRARNRRVWHRRKAWRFGRTLIEPNCPAVRR